MKYPKNSWADQLKEKLNSPNRLEKIWAKQKAKPPGSRSGPLDALEALRSKKT